ncbi:MAG: D-aminoacyl-tRNA deacylase [Flavobacteriaceae bacterium]
MKLVIQRCLEASVKVDGKLVSSIDKGLLILLGVSVEDAQEDVDWLVNKVAHMRIFNDENGVMNKSILDCGFPAIVVSQFTLQASTKKGHRPSYIKAAKAEQAIPLYERFVSELEAVLNQEVGTGVFGADMKVALINDGPITIVIDSKLRS